jgi:hypothetical protein
LRPRVIDASRRCDLIDISAGYLTTCNRKRVADEGREGIQFYLLLGAIYVLNCLHTGFTIAPFQMDFTRRHLAPELFYSLPLSIV